MRQGFTAAIEAMDDLKLDVPDVVDQLALFICRWGSTVLRGAGGFALQPVTGPGP